MTSRIETLLCGAALAIMAQGVAVGQTVETAGSWEQPYGVGGQSPIGGAAGAASRDENGNRIIVDGLMQTGVGVQTQRNAAVNGDPLFGGVGSSATAVGNQLNVNVIGSWNTVVVNSTQVNNGDINANAQSSVPYEEVDD